jgi:hypothetical protein
MILKMVTKPFCGLLLLLMISGCAALQPGSQSAMDEDSLRKRVEQCWTARINGEMQTVYDFTVEEYRKTHSRELFGSKSNTRPESHTIKEIVIDPSSKSATVLIDYTMTHMAFKFPFKIQEDWVWENGNWYLKIK